MASEFNTGCNIRQVSRFMLGDTVMHYVSIDRKIGFIRAKRHGNYILNCTRRDGSDYLYECSNNFIKSAKIILTEKNDF